MNSTQANFYFKLQKKGTLRYCDIRRTVHQQNVFYTLLKSNVLKIQPKGSGKQIFIAKPKSYERFLQEHFPQGDPTGVHAPKDTIQSHAKYGNSKTVKRTTQDRIVFLRGSDTIDVNDQRVNLAHATQYFGTFACVIQRLCAPKLCFVENKDVFLRAEAIIPKGYIFMHTYGRVGATLMKNLEVSDILLLSDYDYVGLNEYLLYKHHFPHTTFYMPPDYDRLYAKYSRPLREKSKGGQQRPTQRVKESKDPIVQKLFKQLSKTNRFLEQQVLLHHAS